MKTIFITINLFIGLFYWHEVVYAQESAPKEGSDKDTTTISYYLPKNAFSSIDTIVLDTSLHYSQRYDARSADLDATASTMTIGGPTKDLYFNTLTPTFSIGNQFLAPYFYQAKNMPHFYNVKIPYSELFYTMGSQEENYLKGVIASQVSKRIYYGINFNVESTLGLYTNQRVGNSHANGILSYQSFNKKYKLETEYIHNKFRFGENGGLSNDSYYRDSTQYPRQVLAVNLNTANNTLKSNFFSAKQHYNIGKAATDSTANQFIGKVYLNTSYQRIWRIYQSTGPDTNYYKHIYLDSLGSFDSTTITNFTMDFGVSNFYPSKHQYFIFNIGTKYNYKTYYDGLQTYFFNYYSPHAEVILDFYKVIVDGGATYQIQIPNTQSFTVGSNDFNLFGTLRFPLLKNFNFKVGMKLNLVSPQITAYRYYANNFHWKNTFNKQKQLELNALLNYNGYQIEANIHTISDYVYFDQQIEPQQYTGSFQLFSTKFKKRFNFHRLGSTLMLLYQQSSNDQIIRLPQFIGRSSFYYAFPLFKGALVVHPGIDISYYSAYYGDGYNPSLMQFHLQDKQKLGNQLYADVFVNFKIKRARIFIKYQNVSSHLGNYNYFLVAHYPQQDAVLKFGVSWRFFD